MGVWPWMHLHWKPSACLVLRTVMRLYLWADWREGECCGTVKLSSLPSAGCTAGLQKWHTAWGEMTVYVTGLGTECWFNTMLGGERLYPLRDVLFLLYPHVSDPPCHPTVEISPLGRVSPRHRCLCDSSIKAARVIYSDTGWPQEHTGSYHLGICLDFNNLLSKGCLGERYTGM